MNQRTNNSEVEKPATGGVSLRQKRRHSRPTEQDKPRGGAPNHTESPHTPPPPRQNAYLNRTSKTPGNPSGMRTDDSVVYATTNPCINIGLEITLRAYITLNCRGDERTSGDPTPRLARCEEKGVGKSAHTRDSVRVVQCTMCNSGKTGVAGPMRGVTHSKREW
jgi:hypothetical protein